MGRAESLFKHNSAFILTGQKKSLRSIILLLEAQNRSIFLNTSIQPEAARGWLPSDAVQEWHVQDTTVVTAEPGLIITSLLWPCSPHVLKEEDLFASEGIWEFSLCMQLAHKSRMLSKWGGKRRLREHA